MCMHTCVCVCVCVCVSVCLSVCAICVCKVWEVSVKLGAEDPQEKELAGELALGVTLLLFEIGNTVIAVLRCVALSSRCLRRLNRECVCEDLSTYTLIYTYKYINLGDTHTVPVSRKQRVCEYHLDLCICICI